MGRPRAQKNEMRRFNDGWKELQKIKLLLKTGLYFGARRQQVERGADADAELFAHFREQAAAPMALHMFEVGINLRDMPPADHLQPVGVDIAD